MRVRTSWWEHVSELSLFTLWPGYEGKKKTSGSHYHFEGTFPMIRRPLTRSHLPKSLNSTKLWTKPLIDSEDPNLAVGTMVNFRGC
jgi:hypothetical protein